MNYSMIFYIIGWILVVEAALMVPSGVVAIIYGESCGWVFAVTILPVSYTHLTLPTNSLV